MDKRVMDVEAEWIWLMQIAKEIKHGEATIQFYNGKPINVDRPLQKRNYTAENRKQ